jgi:hypothetical protein
MSRGIWRACFIGSVTLVAGSAVAQKIDRTNLLEAVRKDCAPQNLPDKKLIDALLVSGGNITDFCECLAVRFTSQVDDEDSGHEETLEAKMIASKRFCLAVSMRAK